MTFSLTKVISIIDSKIESWLEIATSMLPNFLVAVLLLILFFFLAKLAKAAAEKLFRKMSDREVLVNLFSTLVYLFVLGIGTIIALNLLHLQQTVGSLLAGAGIIGLALGFAFQDITANFMAGIIMAFRKPIVEGDIIESNGSVGVVEKIDLRVTVLKTFQGLHVLIPNKNVFHSPITNYTKTKERRIDIEVGVSYADDLEKVQEVTTKAIQSLPFLIPGLDVEFSYKEFASSSINFVVMFWIDYLDQPGYLKARSEAIIIIKKTFDEHNITIPFPIRTLDFGIKGGKELSEIDLNTINK